MNELDGYVDGDQEQLHSLLLLSLSYTGICYIVTLSCSTLNVILYSTIFPLNLAAP